MEDEFKIDLDYESLLKYEDIQEYINYLRSIFNPIKEQPVKKLELTEISLLF